MAKKKTAKKVNKKKPWFGRKPTAAPDPELVEEVAVVEAPPAPKAKPSRVDGWPAGSPDPDDVQKNDKGEHIIDRPAGGDWVFKLKTNKKFIVQES